MTDDSQPSSSSPSFSTARRWKIGFDTLLRTVLVLAVVVMANYISSLFSRPFYLSSQTRVSLSPRTISILQTMTNQVDVTVYYNKNDGMFSTIMALLKEYHRIDPRINIKVVDYLRDAGEAAQVQQKYGLAAQATDPNAPPKKNVVIFDLAGANPPRFKVAPGDALVQLDITGMTKDKQYEFSPVAFNGEKMFTSMLLAIANPQPFNAYFLQGDGEASPIDTHDNGYVKFTEILQENYVRVLPLSLSSVSDVPSDCNLLIIAGPQTIFLNSDLAKMDRYLSQGGRLLLLLDYNSIKNSTGLEDFLSHYGVNVGMEVVEDPSDTDTRSKYDIIVENFATHPVVNSLIGSKLEMILPRPVGLLSAQDAPANAPTVTALAFSSPNAVIDGQHGVAPRSYPLMVAVEQNAVKGVANVNGTMRMIVTGDSLFLDNQVIEAGKNRDFASDAVNWLLDRPLLLNGIGPAPVAKFRLLMTPAQVRNVRWLLLAALPGVVLALGGLVWLRRRK